MDNIPYAPEKSGPHEFVLPNGNHVTVFADEYGQVRLSIEFVEYLMVRLLGWHKTTTPVNEHLDTDNLF